MNERYTQPEVIPDTGKPSWGSAPNPFGTGSNGAEFAEAEFVVESESDPGPEAYMFTEHDIYDPNLATRLRGPDAHAFHDRYRWNSDTNKWEPRAHGQEVEQREHGAVIQTELLPGGSMVIRATSDAVALAAIQAIPAIATAQATRPMLPAPRGLTGLPSAFATTPQLPSGVETAKITQQVEVIDDAEDQYPSDAQDNTASSRGIRGEPKALGSKGKRRLAHTAVYASVGLVFFGFAGYRYGQAYFETSGEQVSVSNYMKAVDKGISFISPLW